MDTYNFDQFPAAYQVDISLLLALAEQLESFSRYAQQFCDAIEQHADVICANWSGEAAAAYQKAQNLWNREAKIIVEDAKKMYDHCTAIAGNYLHVFACDDHMWG